MHEIYACTVLQPGFKKGRVPFLKKGTFEPRSSERGRVWEGVDPRPLRGFWGISPKKIFENHT